MRLFLTTAILLAGLASTARAQGYEKGLSLVLLHCWSGQSVNNLVTAIRGSGTTLVEINSAPYIADRCPARDGQIWKNLQAVVSGLVASRINVRVTVYLSDLHRSSASAGFTTRMGEFWNAILSPYAGNSLVSFRAGPSLEDSYSQTEFQNALRYMAAGLTTSQFNRIASQFAFRRCPQSGFGNSSYTQYTAWGRTIAIRHESHGANPRPGYPAWSNDGNFVAYLDTSAEVCVNCYDSPTNFANFQAKTGMSVKLLWRPAYNLAHVSPGPPISYDVSGYRTDSGSPKFNAREAEVVRAFLRP